MYGCREKVWGECCSGQHIKELEIELEKAPCPALSVHILRLKKAWGIRKESPKPVAA